MIKEIIWTGKRNVHKVLHSLGIAVLLGGTSASALPVVWINEFHYDNTGADTGEFIEIAGVAGTSLNGLSIVLYNGGNGSAYDTETLSGVIADAQNGFGFVVRTYPVNGIQNGSPDGFALVFDDPATGVADPVVLQFLSYEGSFSAANGPASGMTSVDIGVFERETEPLGRSLQLTGNGSSDSDFSWSSPSTATPGSVNTGQSFVAATAAVPDGGATIALLMVGLCGLGSLRRRFA